MVCTSDCWDAMNLDNVTVELRPRTEWEAADLGARMVRRDVRTIYATWFAITLPLFALACAVIWFSSFPGLASIGYWWLEPLTDGAILHIISRRLFGEQTGVIATLRETPRLALRNVIFLLPPYRFHFARSVAIPITQLEGLRGARRRARAGILNSRIMNFGTGVTVAYQHLFLALYFGVMLIVFALIPTTYQDSIGMDWFDGVIGESTRSAYLAQLTLLYIAQSALHPWFVGAGFGLYINCRTQLEAWDIEVSFRRMVNRRGMGTALAILLLLPIALPDTASAQEDEPVYTDTGFVGFWEAGEVDTAVKNVFQKEALSTHDDVTVWKSKNPKTEAEKVDGPDLNFGFLENIGRVLAFLVEIWLWLLVAGLLLLLYKTRDIWLPHLTPRTVHKTRQRVILSSGEITAEQLPDDVPAEVHRLWNDGHKREALSLLFRGSVFYLVTQHGVRVPPSATEGACVDAVARQSNKELSAYFEKVVMAWVLFAYGSREPGDATMQTLCNDWSRHYGESQG